MTPLSTTDARAAAALFPGADVVGVLDARFSAPVWADAFPRAWAADGVVVVARRDPPPDGPTVALFPPGPIPTDAREALAAVAGRPFQVLTGADGHLFRCGRALRPIARRTQPVRLAVAGATRIELGSALPVAVRVAVPVAAHDRLLRVEPLRGPGLPPAEWFHLDLPPGSTELRVDVRPGRAGDRWALFDHVGREVGVPAHAPEPAPLQKVILIFDRTCPDRDRWADARALVRGEQSQDEPNLSDFGGGTAIQLPRSVPPRPTQGELNAAIRAGLADGFRDAFGAAVEVELVWFADAPGAMGCPAGVTLPRAVGRGDRRCPAPELAGPLAAAGYAPGLDLWDALEEAVREAARVGAGGPAAVLIVGNSPPHPPTDPDHPFTWLWRTGLPASTVRARGTFPEALAALAEVGPVLTVFLTGHDLPPIGAESFQTVQAAVRDAFAETLPLIEAVADRAGVARAVSAAAARFASWVSGVLVREIKR